MNARFQWNLPIAMLALNMALPAFCDSVLPLRMQKASPPIAMTAYQDLWPEARERWWDIGSYRSKGRDGYNQFNDWISRGAPNGRFDYAARAARVKLTYDQAPGAPYFVGHISARGLKPNFAYQLKLAGKPVAGSRGMGKSASYLTVTGKAKNGAPVFHAVVDGAGQTLPINGDDWTNQQLGYVGRWWNDSRPSANTNAITDRKYRANAVDTIYGYQFVGVFVTDGRGDAECDIIGDRSLHATWQQWQRATKNVFAGAFSLRAVSDGPSNHRYGYGAVSAARSAGAGGLSSMSLFYEWERHRPHPVRLPRGTYHCRLLVTEETFHNDIGATQSYLGGKWKTVLASEDFRNGQADTDVANDIVFAIR